jgi:hypothetical protein
MYLTAQRVRSREGAQGIHAFLHLHDVEGGGGFPADPLTVPQEHPGRLVDRRTEIPMGMNSVLSYLDVIATDRAWFEKPSDFWRRELGSLGELMNGQPLPWVVEAGEMYVIFSAAAAVQVDSEFDCLLHAALGLWDRSR